MVTEVHHTDSSDSPPWLLWLGKMTTTKLKEYRQENGKGRAGGKTGKIIPSTITANGIIVYHIDDRESQFLCLKQLFYLAE